MKYLILSLIVLTSCTKNFDVGQCIQKPDQASIYEITEKNEAEGTYSLVQRIDGNVVESKIESNIREYVKTECPKPAAPAE